MEKTKALTTATLLLCMIGMTSAVVPGEGPEVEKSYNHSVVNVTTEESELFNSSINGSNVSVDVVGLEAKGDYDFSVTLNNTTTSNNSNNSTSNSSFYTRNFSLMVDEYNNFSLRPSNITTNLSIGSSGELETVQIDGKGNSVQEVDLGLEGNISDFVTLLDDDKFVPVNGTRPVNLVYDIPRSTDFGNYNGSLVVNSSNRSRNVSINLSLMDEIRPEFTGNDVSDFMATNPQTFSVDVSDNLGVVNASTMIVREYQKVVNETTNETEMVNETVSEGVMDQSEGNDQKWLYEFEDVDTIGDYYAEFNISDESNNTANLTVPFRISGLDSIEVLDGDFEFEDSRPRTDDSPTRQVTKEVFTKSSDKELDLFLSGVEKGNNTLYIGIKNEDMSNAKDLYDEEDGLQNVTLTESGTYSLVVYSNDAGFSYEGTLNLRPVPQHIEINKEIIFSGAFVDPEYPPLPETRTLGSFEGGMEFVLNDNGVPVGLTYSGEQMDISDCKGANSWSNCLPGYTLGEVPKWKQRVSDMQFEKTIAMSAMGASWLFVIFMIFNGYAEGFAVRAKEVSKSEVGDVVGRNEELDM